ncbi:MAG: N-acetylmuramoyl-L-alanine amidase [Polyangiales bacterium]
MRVHDHRLLRDDGTPVSYRASPNHGGVLTPRFLILHYTAGRSAESSIAWLCNPAARASAHLVIGRDGSVTQLVPFDVAAWHAGASTWYDGATRITGLNQHAIGIELDNPGRLQRQGDHWRSLTLGIEYGPSEGIAAVHKHETKSSGWAVYPAVQLSAALDVAAALHDAYRLKDIMGHDDVAPGRKLDPGPAFPLQSFRGRVFGRAEDGDIDRWTTTTAVNIRVGPGTQHPTVIPVPLPTGTDVEVHRREGVWCEVDVLESVSGVNDVQGWVHGRYLRLVEPSRSAV